MIRKEWLIQFINFSIVGFLNTIISIGTYYVCIYLFHMHYQLANFLGFLVSVTNAYFWNSRCVFKAKTERRADMMSMYAKTLLCYGGTYFLGVGLLWIWVEILHIREGIAPLLNLLITIPTNYLLQKMWVYRKKDMQKTQDQGFVERKKDKKN